MGSVFDSPVGIIKPEIRSQRWLSVVALEACSGAMPPKNDGGPTMTLVQLEEEWAKISGEGAEKDVLFFVELDGGFHKPGPSNKYRDDVTRSIAISKWWAGSGNPQSKKPSVWIRIGYSRELATNRPDWYDTIEQIAMSCMDNEQKLVADKPLYFYCNYDESHWQFKKAKETFKKRQLHLVESSKEITNVGIQYKPGHMFAARTPSSAARRASPSSTSSLRSASRRIARRRRGST